MSGEREFQSRDAEGLKAPAPLEDKQAGRMDSKLAVEELVSNF